MHFNKNLCIYIKKLDHESIINDHINLYIYIFIHIYIHKYNLSHNQSEFISLLFKSVVIVHFVDTLDEINLVDFNSVLLKFINRLSAFRAFTSKQIKMPQIKSYVMTALKPTFIGWRDGSVEKMITRQQKCMKMITKVRSNVCVCVYVYIYYFFLFIMFLFMYIYISN